MPSGGGRRERGSEGVGDPLQALSSEILTQNPKRIFHRWCFRWANGKHGVIYRDALYISIINTACTAHGVLCNALQLRRRRWTRSTWYYYGPASALSAGRVISTGFSRLGFGWETGRSLLPVSFSCPPSPDRYMASRWNVGAINQQISQSPNKQMR